MNSVKIMLSYDYCHFEICKGTDQELSNKEINAMRKDVQRLADEAVRQYKIAKEMAAKREQGKYEMQEFERRIKLIKATPEGERTVNEMAMLKEYEDGKWEERFLYPYDYDDDFFTDWGEET